MDIVEQLRTYGGTGYKSSEPLMCTAAAEIARLRAEWDKEREFRVALERDVARLRAECARLEDHINDADDESIRLRAEVERLTAALKKIVSEAESDDGLSAWDGADIARAALAADGKGG